MYTPDLKHIYKNGWLVEKNVDRIIMHRLSHDVPTSLHFQTTLS